MTPVDLIALDPLELLGLSRPAWWSSAACRGMGSARFYPERAPGIDTAAIVAAARATCAGCAARDACLADALDHDDLDGVRVVSPAGNG